MTGYRSAFRSAMPRAALALVLLSFTVIPGYAAEGTSAFVRLQFGQDVSIEVPRNWTFLDQNIRKHLNTYSEAVVKLSGMDVNQGNNLILVAANTYTLGSGPAATMRLSVRSLGEKCPTQSEIKFADPLELKRSAELSLQQLSSSLPDNVRSIQVIDARVERLGRFYSLVTEQQTNYVTGPTRDRLDVVCAGSKRYKLYTSYRKSEAWMFEPVIRHIRQSLIIAAK